MKRKMITMLVTISVPGGMTPRDARKEVRDLITHQRNNRANLGDVKARKVLPHKPEPENYAVIYDVQHRGKDDTEEYYEMFSSPAEAAEMFGTAFGADKTVHNARLVRILKTIKESRH